MGIVNVTPDSFSDGGRYLDPERAIQHGLQLAGEGADILDIGGESTRPGALPVDPVEECRRVLPVIRGLAAAGAPPLSIDTRHPLVAEAALDAGACIVNDVEACRPDTALWEIVRDAGAGYVCMHMQGDPRTMQAAPTYADIITEIGDFFRDRLQRLGVVGVDPAQVVLDPGIGFGKTLAHNLELLRKIGDFTRLPNAILLGISRKSFIGKISGADSGDRLAGSLASTIWAAQSGVRIFRTHDVAQTRQALITLEAIQTGSPHPHSDGSRR